MPFSARQNRTWAAKHVAGARPRLILDIGPGEGTYADLLRPLLPHTAFHGIEAWGPYVDRFNLLSKYDAITVGDVRTFEFPRGDYTVIMGDVLEHMPEEDGRAVIANIKANAKHLLLSVPVLHKEQGATFGNPFERHVRHWKASELNALMGPCPSAIGNVLARYWWTRP
jgi:methyltransferase family protein